MRKIPEKIELIMAYNNLKPKAPLGEAKVISITNNIAELKTMQFEIRQTINRGAETLEHPAFEKIQVEQIVLLKDYGYYVIKNITRAEDGEGMKKTVECVSIESKLAKKMIVLPHKVIQLQKNDLDKEDGILDIMERETGWKVRHIDKKAQYDDIGGGVALKYRNIEVSETWWNFLSQTLQQAFDIVIYFDHLNREISIFDRLSFGRDTKLILSRRNYLESISKTFDNTDIITRMYVEGEDGVAINPVNPLGTNYVEDFSFFATEEYMSKELIEALEIYYPLLEELQIEWEEENEKLLALQRERLTKEEGISTTKEEIKAKKHLQTEALKDEEGNPEGEKLKELKAIIDELELKLKGLEEDLETIDKAIEEQLEVMADISRRMSKEEMEIEGEKVFNEESLEELDSFIMEGSWQNTYYSTNSGLYYGAKTQLNKICRPTFEMSVGLNQLALDIFQAKTITTDLYDLGDFVIVENEETSIRKKSKEIVNPIVKGLGKNHRITVGENGELITEYIIGAKSDDIILTDITGKNHFVTVDSDGRLVTNITDKKSRNRFKLRGTDKIYQIKVNTEGVLILEEDVEISKNNKFEKVRIIGYSYSPETQQTELILSTAEFSLTQEGKLSASINSAVNAGKTYHRSKMTLEQARLNANWIDDYYRNALDVAHKNIMAAMGSNEISITENGIIIRDKRNVDDIVMMAVGGIILSTDGLESVRTAITADGICAEEIMGKLIIGENLIIADEKGEFEIKGNLLTVKDNFQKVRVMLGEYDKGVYGLKIVDDKGEVAIDARGMLQRERISYCDNLDEKNPYSVLLPLDEGLTEIREASMWVEPKRFRGYTKSVKGGGGKSYTSASSSTTTSGSSSITTSSVNNNNDGAGGGFGSGSYGSGWATGFKTGNGGTQLSELYGGNHKHYIGYVSGTTINHNVYETSDGDKKIGVAKGYPLFLMQSNGTVVSVGAVGRAPTGTPIIVYTSDVKPVAIGEISRQQEGLMEPDMSDEVQQMALKLWKNVVSDESIFKVSRENIRNLTMGELIDSNEKITEREFHNALVYEMALRNASAHKHEDFSHYHSNKHAHNMQHNHNMEHNHKVTIDEHTHPVEFGIYEDTEFEKPTVSIWGRVDEGTWTKIFDNINVRTKLNLKSWLDKVNVWGKDNLVEIQIRANNRARIEGSMLIKAMTKY